MGRKMVGLVLVSLLLGLGVTACNASFLNCRDSGICPFTDTAPYTISGGLGDLTVMPGQSVTATLQITRSGVADGVPVVLRPSAGVAGMTSDPNVIAIFDQGRVQVKWDGQPITGNTTTLTVTAAQQTTSGQHYFLTDSGATLQKQGDSYTFKLSGTINIQ